MNDAKAVISLGSNLGNKKKNLDIAINLIGEFSSIITKSHIYYSEPWGYQSNHSFLNMGMMVKTKLKPLDLLKKLKNIENKMGRLPKEKDTYEDRLIDLDILIFENSKINQRELIIPHPKIKERKFSLLILKDIFGDEYISELDNSAGEMLMICNDHSKVEVIEHGV